jgi:HAD superfamily hydrolase (TIGR01509 family)
VIQAVLFDFNGVIVDDESQHCEAFQRVLAAEGIALTREQYYADYLGLDDRTGFVEAYRRAARTLTTELLSYLVAQKSEVYLNIMSAALPIVPGAREFVRAAATRFRLGIVSGALRREIDAMLARTGRDFASLFEIIIAAEDVRSCKPDPAAYLAGLDALNRRKAITAGACVVVEDSLPGLAAARAAGMPCVVLTTSHPSERFAGRGAAMVWDSFAGHTPAELAAV